MESNLTLPLLDTLLEVRTRSRPPRCEVWVGHIPRGQVFKLMLNSDVMPFVEPYTETGGIEEVFLVSRDDLTDEIMETLRDANITVFDFRRK